MRWCPSVRGPLTSDIVARLRCVKWCLAAIYLLAIVPAGESDRSVAEAIVELLCALSGTLVLLELGVVNIRGCCCCFRGSGDGRSPSIREMPGDISVCWLPPFFLLAALSGVNKVLLIIRYRAPGGLLTSCIDSLNCLHRVLYIASGALQLAAVVLLWRAVRLVNSRSSDEDSLLSAGDLRSGMGSGRAPSSVELRTPVSRPPEEVNIFTPREGGAEEEGLADNVADAGAVGVDGGLFRVRVPGGWPGVQYRKSKNFEDRYKRYAVNGTMVAGKLEDDDQWLRLGSDIFLPVRLGAIQLIESVPQEQWVEDQE